MTQLESVRELAQPLVCIVILNREQLELTSDCLRSLANLNYSNFEVVLVDNGSRDGSAERLRKEFPEATVLICLHNQGVAGGRNLGARQALASGAQYIFFLDNDAEVQAGCLTCLVDLLRRDSSVGAAAPAVYIHGSPDQLFSLGGIYYPPIGYGRLRFAGRPAPQGLVGPLEADWLGGVATLARRSVFDKVGFLDEDYNPYGSEDLDWGLRIRKAGYRLYVVPEAVVWHKNRPGYQLNAAVVGHWARGHIIFLRKHVPLHNLPLSVAFTFGYLVFLRRLVPLLLHGDKKGVRALAQGIWAGLTHESFG